MLTKALQSGGDAASSGKTQGWPPEAYIVELSGNGGVNGIKSQAANDFGVDKLADLPSKQFEQEPSDISVDPAEVESADVVEDASAEKSDKVQLVEDLSTLRSLLGISGIGSAYDIDSLISSLANKISRMKDETTSLMNDILEEHGINLEEDDKVNISIAEDGSIEVTSLEGGQKGKERAAKIQEALNDDPEQAEKLSGLLRTTALEEEALYQIQTHGNAEGGGIITNDLALALVEDKLGMSIEMAMNEGDVFDENLEAVGKFAAKNPELVKSINSMANPVAMEVNPKFTFSNGELTSGKMEDSIKEIQKSLENQIVDSMMGYNDPVLVASGLAPVPPPPPPECRIESFEATITVDGRITVTGGKNGVGEELSSILKDICESFITKEGNNDGSIDAMISMMLSQHQAEHGDTEEFEHMIKLKVGYPEGVDFEIISPEADAAAKVELDNSMQIINDGVNRYFQNEYGFESTVQVEVNESGALVVSEEGLSETEYEAAKAMIDMINESVKVANSSEAEEDDNEKPKINLPIALQEAFSEARGLRDILDKFHERDNLSAAISGEEFPE
jgi:hypothetical protein